MQVGYLPDMFGHVAQMPQLLAQFGFDQTVVWRGVPEAIDAPAFWWEAPDGSRVRAAVPRHRLQQRLGPARRRQGARRPDRRLVPRAGRPGRRPGALDERHRPPPPPGPPRPGGGRGQRPAGRLPPRGHLARRTTSRGRGADADGAAAGRGRGELRSGARANLLMGVASNRVDVHQAEMRTTRAARADRRAALRALPAGRPLARPLPRRGVARGHPQLAPTTRSAPARSTRWAGPSSTASTRPAPSPRA